MTCKKFVLMLMLVLLCDMHSEKVHHARCSLYCIVYDVQPCLFSLLGDEDIF